MNVQHGNQKLWKETYGFDYASLVPGNGGHGDDTKCMFAVVVFTARLEAQRCQVTPYVLNFVVGGDG